VFTIPPYRNPDRDRDQGLYPDLNLDNDLDHELDQNPALEHDQNIDPDLDIAREPIPVPDHNRSWHDFNNTAFTIPPYSDPDHALNLDPDTVHTHDPDSDANTDIDRNPDRDPNHDHNRDHGQDFDRAYPTLNIAAFIFVL